VRHLVEVAEVPVAELEEIVVLEVVERELRVGSSLSSKGMSLSAILK
jgi:hypothetical protein